MELQLKYFFLVSVLIHSLLLYFSSLNIRKVTFIKMDSRVVDVVRVTLPPSLPVVETKPVPVKVPTRIPVSPKVSVPTPEEVPVTKQVKQPITKPDPVPQPVVSKPVVVPPLPKVASEPIPTVNPTPVPTTNIAIDTDKFPYTYYIELVKQKVGRHWKWTEVEDYRSAQVFFRINRSGNITHLKIERSSEDEDYDWSILRALRLADPFPPLPEGFTDQYLGVHFEFIVK